MLKQIFVNDYEVLGVSAKKKRDLIQAKSDSELVLLTHKHHFLPGLFEQTKLWLLPAKIVADVNFDKEFLLQQAFLRIFPESSLMLGQSTLSLIKNYVTQMPWKDGLLDDHFRYFGFYYKKLFPKDNETNDILLWEWIQNSLSYLDYGDSFKLNEDGIAEINPSLQIVRLQQYSKFLKREKGLYGFVYNQKLNRLEEKAFTAGEAEILDLLSADSKFSKEQIIEILVSEKGTSKMQLLTGLESLVSSDYIRL